MQTIFGLYLHIPFCKQACHYCDFHFSTGLGLQERMVAALLQEMKMREGGILETVYFGGGTPSLLSDAALSSLMEGIHRFFSISSHAEITLEANPDDISTEKLALFKQLGINRLSIGIQSFHGPHLQMMNRAHSAQEAQSCVKLAQDAGFDNLSIDLIYGIPTHTKAGEGEGTHRIWQNDMDEAFALRPAHLSAYCLTIEEKTAFGQWKKKGNLPLATEDFAAEQFEMLLQRAEAEGYEQYEISNFCLPGQYSKHNSSYWKGAHYIGVGPSAHSYDGEKRQYNVANNMGYIKAIEAGQLPAEVEILSDTDKANDYLLTTLRTAWGCDLGKIRALGFDWEKSFGQKLKQHLAWGNVRQEGETIFLTQKGKLIADKITEDFFL